MSPSRSILDISGHTGCLQSSRRLHADRCADANPGNRKVDANNGSKGTILKSRLMLDSTDTSLSILASLSGIEKAMNG
eukprot:6198440-Pleurochrysis_carterae.AAC.5